MIISAILSQENTSSYFPDTLPEPDSYFQGIEAPNRPRTNNLIPFLRTSRSNLQQLNFANRSHHRHVLLLVLETAGSVIVDGAEHKLKPGQAYYVKPFQFHHYLNLESEKLRWLFLTFDLDSEPEELDALSHRTLTIEPEQLEIWQHIVERASSSSINQQIEAVTLLDLLLLQLRIHTPRKDSKSTKSSWIAKAEGLVLESVAQNWTLVEVSRQLGMSERHLRSLFQKEMGVSIRQYRANYQLHRAIKLMRVPNFYLGQIAEMCGFNSQAVFNRFILRETGQTPLALRKQIRSNSGKTIPQSME